ncbi:MAG: transposase [Planctomycetes bacterium]|nr:transposase [Planctomycetota bacterium]
MHQNRHVDFRRGRRLGKYDHLIELYGFRWHSELDIRSIKQTLGLDHVRCKSPSMVRKELWMTLLAYNLIRTTALYVPEVLRAEGN